MFSIMKFLALLVCFELIISPVAPTLSLLNQKAFAESCPTGMSFDSTLNRCLTTAQAANVLNSTLSCPSGDVECYKTNAQNAFQEKVNAGDAPERVGDKGGLINTVGKAASIAVPLSILISTMKTNVASCVAPALWTMVGGAAAMFVGDTLANMGHKSRLKKIKEDWGKIVNPEEAKGDKDKERTTSIEAQSEAFEMLARAEDSLAKAAGMKKMFYTVAALAFTASAALAVMEHFKLQAALAAGPGGAAAAKGMYICTPKGASFSPNKSLFEMYVNNIKPELPYNLKQFSYNINHSEDLASVIMNSKSESFSSPSIDEYLELQELISTDPIDKSGFEMFKEVISKAASSFSIFPEAYAEDKKEGIDTNAAKMFKEDKAKGIDLMGLGLGVAAGVGIGMAMKGKVIMPLGRAAIAGLLAAWTMIMRGHAAKQQSASKKRAELLRKMKDEFASAGGAIYACKSEDRNDPANPNCYCYTPENQRNNNRSNSQVCQKLWAGKSLNPTDYNKLASNSLGKVCINSQNQADASCACKSNNSCMKVKINGLSGINPGTMSLLSSSIDPVNKIADGSIDAGNIDAASLDNQAAKLLALKDKLENSKGAEAFKKNKDKETLDITNKLNSAGAGISPNAVLGNTDSGFPSNPGQAALALEKELDDAVVPTAPSQGTVGGPGEGAPNENLEFGLNQDQLAAQDAQVAEVMKENLDFGGNDINPGSTTNLFEVLSNRYQRSGMRRLFDEKGTTEAEPAAKSDITK